MEQEKKVNEERKNLNPNGEGAQGGRRKKKHRHRNKGGQCGNVNVQPQGGNIQAQAQNQPKNAQPQGGQKNQPKQNGGQNKSGQNVPKNTPNKQQNSGQNQPKNNQKKQNGGGRVGSNDKNDRKDTYAYVLDGNLYINLTNKCSNGCDFCVRNERDSYFGYYLWIRQGDPTPEKVIAQVNALGDITRFKEAVFCGFGEPTYKMEELVALCDFFHSKGLSTRLNTNGQGCLINKRDIVPELVGKIDLVNVSLNASCAEKYQPICRSQFGENGFGAMIEFAKACKRAKVNCRFSIVDCIGKEEVDACKKLAASVGVPLLVRDYITES